MLKKGGFNHTTSLILIFCTIFALFLGTGVLASNCHTNRYYLSDYDPFVGKTPGWARSSLWPLSKDKRASGNLFL